ncbi:hypothetical protein [Nocardiopsis sp. NPDC006938]|uniref:hypothetical protein n=1 Tax=Nocardiopsis sp. NPDC006938 TaxID=3364337 RepID=UPI003673B062
MTPPHAGSSVGAASMGLFLTVAPPGAGYPLVGAVLVVVAAAVLLTAGSVLGPGSGRQQQ